MSQKIFSKTGKKIIDLILYSKQRNQNMKATSGQLEYKNKNKKQKNLLDDFTFKIECTCRERSWNQDAFPLVKPVVFYKCTGKL